MINYTIPDNYKKCSKKQYEIYVCKPPFGTIIINALEQANIVSMLNGKTFFTAEEVTKIQNNPKKKDQFDLINNLIQNNQVYVVGEDDFVLAGTLGEMWTIKAKKLAERYTFMDKGNPLPITDESFKKRADKEGYLNWTLVKTVKDAGNAWACFVPVPQQGQVATSWGTVLNINGAGVNHGKGDFIIAQDAGGVPNLNDVYVVNGNIFATTYNLKGWSDCVDKKFIDSKAANITIDKLPKLFKSGYNERNYKEIEDKLLQGVFSISSKMLEDMLKYDFVVTFSDISLENPSNKYKLEIKERDLDSELTTTLFLAREGNKINIRGKREGLSLDRTYHIKVDIVAPDMSKVRYENIFKSLEVFNSSMNNLNNVYIFILVSLMYLELTKDLKVTPYRYLTKRDYLSRLVSSVYTDDQLFSCKMNIDTFKREKKSEGKTNLSMAAFKTLYLDYPTKTRKLSEYQTIVKVKINNEELDNYIKYLRDVIKDPNLNPELYAVPQAFKLEVKVATGEYYCQYNPCDFESVFRGYTAKAFYDERRRSKASNIKTKTKKLLAEMDAEDAELKAKYTFLDNNTEVDKDFDPSQFKCLSNQTFLNGGNNV